MKSVGTLRKKGLGGADHFLKKEKSKNSSPSSSSSPTTSSTAASSSTNERATSSHKSLHLSRKSVYATQKSSHNMQQQVPQVPITVDLHRFADDNLQPEECKSFLFLLNKQEFRV